MTRRCRSRCASPSRYIEPGSSASMPRDCGSEMLPSSSTTLPCQIRSEPPPQAMRILIDSSAARKVQGINATIAPSAQKARDAACREPLQVGRSGRAVPAMSADFHVRPSSFPHKRFRSLCSGDRPSFRPGDCPSFRLSENGTVPPSLRREDRIIAADRGTPLGRISAKLGRSFCSVRVGRSGSCVLRKAHCQHFSPYGEKCRLGAIHSPKEYSP